MATEVNSQPPWSESQAAQLVSTADQIAGEEAELAAAAEEPQESIAGQDDFGEAIVDTLGGGIAEGPVNSGLGGAAPDGDDAESSPMEGHHDEDHGPYSQDRYVPPSQRGTPKGNGIKPEVAPDAFDDDSDVPLSKYVKKKHTKRSAAPRRRRGNGSTSPAPKVETVKGETVRDAIGRWVEGGNGNNVRTDDACVYTNGPPYQCNPTCPPFPPI